MNSDGDQGFGWRTDIIIRVFKSSLPAYAGTYVPAAYWVPVSMYNTKYITYIRCVRTKERAPRGRYVYHSAYSSLVWVDDLLVGTFNLSTSL
jgi:hypothetical protein